MGQEVFERALAKIEKNNVNNFAMSQQFNIFAKHKTPISNI